MSGGQGFTSGQGSIASTLRTVALVGIAIASTGGALLGSESGQRATLSQGTVVQSLEVALTGQAVTPAAGTLVARNAQPALTGQAVTSGHGTVSAGGQPVTAHLSGADATFTAGTVDSGHKAISGIASTSAAGTAALLLEQAITGLQSEAAAGSVAAQQDADDTRLVSAAGSAALDLAVDVVGLESAAEQGDIGLTSDVDQPLAGEAATGAAGTLEYERAFALTGAAAAFALDSLGAPGGVDLVGAEVAVVAGDVFLDEDRSYALVGEAVTAQDGITFASSLAFPPGAEIVSGIGVLGDQELELVGEESVLSAGEMAGAISDLVVADSDAILGVGSKPSAYDDDEPVAVDNAMVLELLAAIVACGVLD
jgi:hypothetical protein